MMRKTATQRNSKGTAIAESPFVLLVLFIFLAFPMINLGAIGYRSYFLIASCKEAAHKASKSLTYQTKVPDVQLGNNNPAVEVAQETIRRYLNSFNGVKVNEIKTGIVVVENATGKKSGPFYTPISGADVYGNVYYLEVELDAEAVPMITYGGGLLGNIPGITSPVRIKTHAREVFENPKGLTASANSLQLAMN
ncbi:MAG TPA: hypothetical protein V6D17_21405 [Candidatus Obscuribacterales bacterium]